MIIKDFSYNSKTDSIEANERYVVRYEKNNGDFYFYINYKGKKHYLIQEELVRLRKSAMFFIEHLNCDFGEPINALIKNDYLQEMKK